MPISGGGGIITIVSGGSIIAAQGVHATNTNPDKFAHTGALTGVPSACSKGIVSFWFKLDDAAQNGRFMEIFEQGVASFAYQLSRAADNTWAIKLGPGGSASTVNVHSNTAYTADSTWHHFLASFDTGVPVANVYVDGISDLQAAPTLSGNVDLTSSVDWGLFDRAGGGISAEFTGNIAELYINMSEYLDFSNSTNRALFRSGTAGAGNGHPINLGSDGSIPTTNPPIIFFGGNQWLSNESPVNNWGNNHGTGGSFAPGGSTGLTLSSTNP